MLQRKFLTLVVCVFLCSGEIFSQQKNVEKIPVITGNFLNMMTISSPKQAFLTTKKFFNNGSGKADSNCSGSLSKPNYIKYYFNPVVQNYYITQLGFFCRKELQIEKATTLPLRFRLGSLAYTDYMEKKPNAFFRR